VLAEREKNKSFPGNVKRWDLGARAALVITRMRKQNHLSFARIGSWNEGQEFGRLSWAL
jgi:hypothetical protein